MEYNDTIDQKEFEKLVYKLNSKADTLIQQAGFYKQAEDKKEVLYINPHHSLAIIKINKETKAIQLGKNNYISKQLLCGINEKIKEIELG